MKNTLNRFAMVAVACLALAMGTAQAAQQQKLTVSAVAAANTAHINGTTGEAAVLVSVSDPEGKPVTTLQSGNFAVVTTVVPSVCGLGASKVFEMAPGFYQLSLSLPNYALCMWAYGDYVGTVQIIQVPNQAGIAPFKLTINGDTALQQVPQ